MTLGRALAALVIGVIAAAVTVAALAPAAWAGAAVSASTGGRVELAEATGTLWAGEATVVFASGEAHQKARASLPQRLSWRLSPWRLLGGELELALSHPSALSQTLIVHAYRDGSATLGPATLHLPASLLVGLGAPWNTVRPGGVLTVSWDTLQIGGGKVRGHLSADWADASSALSPVSPLGHYRLLTNGVFPGTRLDLETVSGPLELAGSGTIAEGGRLRFQGVARAEAAADPAVKTQLAGLISLLGRRDGETAILNFGS